MIGDDDAGTQDLRSEGHGSLLESETRYFKKPGFFGGYIISATLTY
jgi:hypothetical protein